MNINTNIDDMFPEYKQEKVDMKSINVFKKALSRGMIEHLNKINKRGNKIIEKNEGKISKFDNKKMKG